MNDIRAKFEEIWPVPEGVEFCDVFGGYWHESTQDKLSVRFREYDIRLDTFTRCQETMAPVMSLVDELIKDLEWINEKNEDHYLINQIDRAKQIIGREK